MFLWFGPTRKRSSLRVWGVPLYDIALGPDPEKGELHGQARGVFACGDRATGFIAVGSYARALSQSVSQPWAASRSESVPLDLSPAARWRQAFLRSVECRWGLWRLVACPRDGSRSEGGRGLLRGEPGTSPSAIMPGLAAPAGFQSGPHRVSNQTRSRRPSILQQAVAVPGLESNPTATPAGGCATTRRAVSARRQRRVFSIADPVAYDRGESAPRQVSHGDPVENDPVEDDPVRCALPFCAQRSGPRAAGEK